MNDQQWQEKRSRFLVDAVQSWPLSGDDRQSAKQSREAKDRPRIRGDPAPGTRRLPNDSEPTRR